jgi:hypothetical protein
VTNISGTTVTFTVNVTGAAPLAYQWSKDGVALADGGNVSGARSNVLTLANVQSADAGQYSVVVTNVAGTVTSRVASLTVLGAHYVIQPGPADSKDIWTTSVYSFAPGGGGPGGGENDYSLLVAGWGDWYYSLIQFDLTGVPGNATSAVLYLYCYHLQGSTTPMYLDRIRQAWDWRTSGTGQDRERLWWADRPAATQWLPNTIPAPVPGQWYAVDITGLYNAWQSGLYPNYGLQLRPQLNSNNYDAFYSADYTGDPTLRPKLVITAPEVVGPSVQTLAATAVTTTAAHLNGSIKPNTLTTTAYFE